MNNMTMIVYGLNTLLMKLGINATIDLSSLMGSSDSMYYGGGMYMSDSGSGTVMSIIPIWLVLAAIGFAWWWACFPVSFPPAAPFASAPWRPSGTIKSNAPSRKGGRVFV